MRTALCFIRTSLALWFCLGAQVHLSLDHTAYWEHEAEVHAPAVHETEVSHETLHCICGTVAPAHHHHGHHVAHDHEVDAVTAKSTQRTLHLMAVAILPALPVEVGHRAEPAVMDSAPIPIASLYLSRVSTPRAPPAA